MASAGLNTIRTSGDGGRAVDVSGAEFFGDGRMFQTPKVKSAQAAIGPDRNEYVPQVGEPHDVIDFAIVRDELCDGH